MKLNLVNFLFNSILNNDNKNPRNSNYSEVMCAACKENNKKHVPPHWKRHKFFTDLREKYIIQIWNENYIWNSLRKCSPSDFDRPVCGKNLKIINLLYKKSPKEMLRHSGIYLKRRYHIFIKVILKLERFIYVNNKWY